METMLLSTENIATPHLATACKVIKKIIFQVICAYITKFHVPDNQACQNESNVGKAVSEKVT